MNDKFRGCLYGVAVGDALGAVLEFARCKPKLVYDGYIATIAVNVQFQFAEMIIHPGAVTDDTEMTLSLYKALQDQNMVYDRSTVIKSYLDWANLSRTPMGRNTRALMKGVTTVKGFMSRWNKVTNWETRQSNGSLMRCAPLALLDNWEEASDFDVALTNNNSVNKECSRVYLTLLRAALVGQEVSLEQLILSAQTEEVRLCVQDVFDGKERTASGTLKGWVVTALYVAIRTFYQTLSYQGSMDFIADHFGPGTDTDTIMAITGALVGARLGYEGLLAEERTAVNIDRVHQYFATSSRPFSLEGRI